MNRKNLLIIAFTVLLVSLGNWLTEEGVKRVDERLTEEPQALQDYYLRELTITMLNDQGRVQHHLQAQQLSHYATSGETQLLQPTLDVYAQKQLQWRVKAERGTLLQQRDEMILEGDVKMVKPSAKPPLALTTSQLRIQPQQGVVDTNRAVTLVQDGNRIDAVGMRIEREGQRLVLLSQVRGRYETLAP